MINLFEMGEELPILKGILKGVVNYHNARTYHSLLNFLSVKLFVNVQHRLICIVDVSLGNFDKRFLESQSFSVYCFLCRVLSGYFIKMSGTG